MGEHLSVTVPFSMSCLLVSSLRFNGLLAAYSPRYGRRVPLGPGTLAIRRDMAGTRKDPTPGRIRTSISPPMPSVTNRTNMLHNTAPASSALAYAGFPRPGSRERNELTKQAYGVTSSSECRTRPGGAAGGAPCDPAVPDSGNCRQPGAGQPGSPIHLLGRQLCPKRAINGRCHTACSQEPQRCQGRRKHRTSQHRDCCLRQWQVTSDADSSPVGRSGWAERAFHVGSCARCTRPADTCIRPQQIYLCPASSWGQSSGWRHHPAVRWRLQGQPT